jgi:hypothetical protein
VAPPGYPRWVNGTLGSVEDPLLDRYLGSFDVRSSFALPVSASPEVTYQAARDLDLGDSLPVMALFAIRAVPHLLSGKVRPSRSMTLDTMLEAGFVMLGEEGPKELVVGAVGKFWRPDSGIERVSADDFVDFDRPGFAKGAMNLRVTPMSGGSLLATETRVLCTDAASRRKFLLYWRAIAPFSGYIRVVMLRRIRKAAEAPRP